MNKTRLISYITLGLVLLNVVLIFFILADKPKPPRHEGPRDIIIERLGFDAGQVRAYDQLIREHRRAVRQQEGAMAALKGQLYGQLLQPQNTALRDSLAAQVGRVQGQIEQIHYSHFRDIQQLCQPEQQAAFGELVQDMVPLFFRRMGELKPRPR